MQSDLISRSAVVQIMENDLLLHESEVEIVEEICTRVRSITAIDVAPDLNTLRDAIYEDAVAHGLWNENDDPTVCSWLIKQEASELNDAASEWNDYGWSEEEPDESFTEELADVIIMSLSVAGKLGIDINAAVRRKMEINKGRSWRHGK